MHVTIRLADRLVNEFILIFFVIINKIFKFTDVVSKFFNVSNLLQLSQRLYRIQTILLVLDVKTRGVFRGDMVPWPLPLGRQCSIISIE